MQATGLVFMPAEAVASLVAGGIGILERQVRQLRHAGARRVFVAGVPPLTVLPAGSEAVTAAQLDAALGGDAPVLVLASGLVVDERALARMAAAAAPALLVADATRPGAQGVERLDALTWAAGVALIGGERLREIARTLGEWDLEATITRVLAADASVARVEWSAIPDYAPARRRTIPLLWARPQSPADAAVLTDAVIAAAQKGCLDWPARFIHAPVEDVIVRLLAPTPVTPNAVTLFTGALGIAAGIAFATGWLWTGLILALITGPLDGVDGKLARTRVEFSKFGDLEHLLDKVLEYGWYLCVAGHFAAVMANMLPWAIAALIILPALSEAIQGEFFRRFSGIQLDDAGPIERRVRLIAGRRNTFLWTWLPFAALHYWFEGFAVLAAYSIATTAVAQWRFYTRIGAYGRGNSAAVAANFEATVYGFLPVRNVSST